MEISSRPGTSWRTPTAYTRIFRARPDARKIKKGPALALRIPSSDPAPKLAPKSASDSAYRVSISSTASSRNRGSEGPANPTQHTMHAFQVLSSPSLKQHQRSRSANATSTTHRPRREDHLLRPLPLRSSANNRPRTSSYNSPRSPGNWTEIYALPNSSLPDAMGSSYAQRTSRMAPAMTGNYAQIDPQSTIYQRRASTSSSVSSSVGTRDTFDAILASPASSTTSFDSWQSTSRKQDYAWQRPAPIKQYRRTRDEGELLAALPDEVLSLILQNLKEAHLRPGSDSCATCMMRDLCSVAVSAKKLLKVARVALYEDIELVGADSPLQKKRLKINYGSRLALLRRTLRSNPAIAVLVRSLKAPAIPQGVAADLYQNLVASVIMACPNFEKLVGPLQNYDFTFSRLFHALSTREQLREMHWTLEASKSQRKRRMSNAAPMLSAGNPNYQEAPGDLIPEQSEMFRDLFMNWANLRTLSIHCLPGATLTPVSLLPDILADMPSLQHLHLSHLPFTAFNDANLLSLPALDTLTLSHLPGVSSTGLSSFARRPSSRTIRKLTLDHLDIDSLPTIAQILSNLISLQTFVLVQTHTPILAEGETIWLYPYLASPTVKKMHWDIPSFATTANLADSVLAKSIAHHGFPALRTLRTPSDPEGIFQGLCKPLCRIEMASDRYRGLIAKAGLSRPKSPPATPTTPKTPRTPGSDKSPFGLHFPMDDQLFPSKVSSDLAHSRLEAQRRLEAASDVPRFTFNLVDERGTVVETKKLAGFVGAIGSPINYCLTSDAGAADENGGLIGISDMLGDGGENLKDGNREGCTGRWNTYNGVVADKKDRERWWHTERGHFTPVEL
ncbi:hypothetical protein F4808DRAFT_406556 [Astrocystis sublimbata]|nr:hypothetical protein F4808DRAFT_406556 [Astrocystis sublimbata]